MIILTTIITIILHLFVKLEAREDSEFKKNIFLRFFFFFLMQTYLRNLFALGLNGEVSVFSGTCFCKNSLRSPFSMYSTIIQKGSSFVQTPRTWTILGSRNLDNIFTSLWKSALACSDAFFLRVFTATNVLLP